MKASVDIPVECNQCLEEVMQDAMAKKELDWERYGREMPQCKECIQALKEDMVKTTGTGLSFNPSEQRSQQRLLLQLIHFRIQMESPPYERAFCCYLAGDNLLFTQSTDRLWSKIFMFKALGEVEAFPLFVG
ncbi:MULTISPECIES: hypothetical protein [unclassified Marinobacterium]|uniref:hypothetical protein n=1 Tax=unclassified Marinobacterium TaxID=2644139 RepID=UPI001569E8DF|nr:MULTISPECIES: hypothetical protein [unclassified Marinobacterium]NRP46201.1 hypothetical protein [Marinobacterium sp. xm-d-543]NRP58600.1 hypothetical protein [Marinobacterium sp. xm-d-564]NRQ22538.1 hypothetical protein [Marinobacterium sp. xm-m-312]